jgi:sterol 3beta-glucosyltransferase
VARSRRVDAPLSSVIRVEIPDMGIHEEVESETEENLASDEEIETEDFERTPQPSSSTPQYVHKLTSSPVGTPGRSNVFPRRTAMTRSGSMATVRLQRRTKLAEKLRDVFELKDIDEVWAEMPCWLLRSVREYPRASSILKI